MSFVVEDGTTIKLTRGDSMELDVGIQINSNCYVYEDGTLIGWSYSGSLSYSYTLPSHSILITYTDNDALSRTVYITAA